jgi:hypothetical protein
MSRPGTVRDEGNVARRKASLLARSNPAARPPYMARPPGSGIGVTCTSRARAVCSTPAPMAARRINGVSK